MSFYRPSHRSGKNCSAAQAAVVVLQRQIHHETRTAKRPFLGLMPWLLDTEEGRGKLDRTRIAAYERARSVGSMHVALMPVLDAFAAELRI